jgi:integrase/recombinase XerD
MAPIRGLMPGSDAIGTIVRYALQRAQVDAPHLPWPGGVR